MRWQLKLSLLILLLSAFTQPCWAKVELSEVFPRPSQGDEWVELHNDSETSVALANWQLWDELSQPSLIYSFTTETIPAHGWLVIPINRKLNDSADGVTLKNTSGQTIDFIHYESAPSDLSWAKVSPTDWIFTTASPGLANPMPTPTPLPTPSPTLTPIPTNTPKPTSTPSPTTAATPTLTPTLTAASSSTTLTATPLPLPTQPVTLSLPKAFAQTKQFSVPQVTPLKSPSPQPTPSFGQPSPFFTPLFQPSPSITPPKIADLITAIMISLGLNSSIVSAYFLRRCLIRYAATFTLTSPNLAPTPATS